MNNYLTWNTTTITDFSDANINSLYNEGYLFTRLGKGDMYQTRSIRINLSKFKLSSENRRILRKIADCRLQIAELPLHDYHWSIGKMAKDFYDTKFGKNIFSANKVKKLLIDKSKSNFNLLFKYQIQDKTKDKYLILDIGYCICYETNEILHYSYPFYNIQYSPPKADAPLAQISNIPNLGLGMMLKAILYAQEHGKKYVYLGSAQRPADTYKLQFEGLEWFDGKEWKNNIDELKKILK